MPVHYSKFFIIATAITIYCCAGFSNSEKFSNSKSGNPLFKQTVRKLACEKSVQKKLQSTLGSKQWVPLLVSEPDKDLQLGIAFRNSKTNLTYSLYGDKTTTTYKVLNKKTNEVNITNWTSKACDKEVVATGKNESPLKKQDQTDGNNYFTDADLEQTLQKNQWGVIFIWSPFMPLSIDALAEIKKAVADQKGHLTVLMDKKASPSQADNWVTQKVILKSELTKVSSNELYERGLGVHYPTAYIYQDGFLANGDFVGHKSSAMYVKWIQGQRKIIQKDLR